MELLRLGAREHADQSKTKVECKFIEFIPSDKMTTDQSKTKVECKFQKTSIMVGYKIIRVKLKQNVNGKAYSNVLKLGSDQSKTKVECKYVSVFFLFSSSHKLE